MSAATARVVQPSPYLTIVLVGEQPSPLDSTAHSSRPQNVVALSGRPESAEEEPTWEDAEWR